MLIVIDMNKLQTNAYYMQRLSLIIFFFFFFKLSGIFSAPLGSKKDAFVHNIVGQLPTMEALRAQHTISVVTQIKHRK